MPATLDDLIGQPYKIHGRGDGGFDCYGLAIEVERRYGKKLNDAYYDSEVTKWHDVNAPSLNVREVSEPAPGIIIEMTLKGMDALHIGVCVDKRRFIHCTEKHGVHVSMIAAFPAGRYFEVV